MAEDDVFERLTHMIEIVSNKRKLSDAQKRTIISLVEMIRSGDTLSDDKLMGYFEHIGGGR